MIQVKCFTFNPFQENTYIIFDESKECIVIDPGCYNENENKIIESFIENQNLKPVLLVNTHCHLDHVFGNQFISMCYNLLPLIHRLDIPMMEYAAIAAKKYGIHLSKLPKIGGFIEEGDFVSFGKSSFKVVFSPGHSPGHICLINDKQNIAICGDVIFNLSIGRTDLPMGNHDDLIKSIRNKLFVLDNNTVIYPGHGPKTTIGFEKKNNPFIQ